jgi:2'-5' RNA ligase
MAFAIELYFDSLAESKIRSAWSELSAASLPAWPLRIGARPHVSILVVDSALREDIDAVFRSLSVEPFRITFTAADHFDMDDAILFLKPGASKELRSLHDRAVVRAKSRGLKPRHFGDEWVPHCTCDYGISQKQLSVGLSIVKRFLPLEARVEEIGSVEVTPESVHQIELKK